MYSFSLCIDCECGTKRNDQFSVISFEWDLIQYLQSKASSSVHTLIGTVTKLSQTFSFSNFIPTFYNHQSLSLAHLVAFDLLLPSHFSCNIDLTPTHTHQNHNRAKLLTEFDVICFLNSFRYSTCTLVYIFNGSNGFELPLYHISHLYFARCVCVRSFY